MRKFTVAAVALLLLATACGAGAGGDERTVLVDYSHDEFASAMFANFPGELTVPQGASVVFEQTWTGEPHTVTGGTLVDDMMARGKPFMDLFGGFETLVASGAELPEPGEDPDLPAEEFFDAVEASDDEAAKRQLYAGYDALREQGLDLPDRNDPGDATNGDLDRVIEEESNKFFEDLGVPWAFEETEEGEVFITQNAGQPCYLTEGGPPKDPEKPCSDAQQEQPEFDGTASYYNSGMIPYEGTQGNTFRVQLADDIEPGSYWFYCAIHGPGQTTELNVVEAGADVPAQERVNRQARSEIAEFSAPMLDAFRDARDGELEMEGETVEGPFAGVSVPAVHGTINEFIPKSIRVDVGEEVTWKIMGADHTVTFGVPEYFPIMTFADDGTVALNDKLQDPAGGSAEIVDAEEGQITKVDGGTYDGTGFFSSGLFGGEPYAEYSLRFSEPGTYKYACLLHPPMVGTVTVS